MERSSHTTQGGVVIRVRFDDSESRSFGLNGDGYLDFTSDGTLVGWDTEFHMVLWNQENDLTAAARSVAID